MLIRASIGGIVTGFGALQRASGVASGRRVLGAGSREAVVKLTFRREGARGGNKDGIVRLKYAVPLLHIKA